MEEKEILMNEEKMPTLATLIALRMVAVKTTAMRCMEAGKLKSWHFSCHLIKNFSNKGFREK